MLARRQEITAELFGRLLDELAAHSGSSPGVTRLAYDPAWRAAHRWLSGQARDLGLAATPDAAGNLFFHDPRLAAGAETAALLVGSHLDSVVDGGRYDGALGTIAGLLAASANLGGTGLPVVGFVSAEEEDSRFHGGMMGARSLLGRVERAELEAVRDRDGVTWGQALEEARREGCAAPPVSEGAPFRRIFRPAAMLELHIEQGPVLESEGLELGIVEQIAGYRRWRVEIVGQARHSGTTPMRLRRDALAAAAELVLAVESLALRTGDPAVATVGYLSAEPGLFNVVPGACRLWIEARHVRPDALGQLAAGVESLAAGVAERRGVRVALEPVSSQQPTALSSDLAEHACRLASELGIAHRRMPSGAAHDSMVFAQNGIPALLVFVPSRGGVSHSPDEHTDLERLFTGYRFIEALSHRLAAEPRPGEMKSARP